MVPATRSVERTSRVLSVDVAESSYTVAFPDRGALDGDEPALARLTAGRDVLLVVDDGAYAHVGRDLTTYAARHFGRTTLLHAAGGEASKTVEEAMRICRAAIDARLPRDGVIVAVGGGALIDTAGFAASIYRRGVAFVRVPTTLVGQVDVSVGIKHAVNVARKKNAVGSFHPPIGSVVDRRALATVPARFIASGIAEIIKLGVVCDAPLYRAVERDGAALFATSFQAPAAAADDLIYRACAIMIDQLQPNLYERDLRRLVDFGHTFSPLLEIEAELTHGEAVGIDMLVSAALAIGRRWCDANVLPRLVRLFAGVGLPVVHPILGASLLETAAAETTAHRAGALHLVVPAALGEGAFIETLHPGELVRALRLLEDAATDVECAS
jgi:3-dehydroquinate synthase